jgi:hypothetical protein
MHGHNRDSTKVDLILTEPSQVIEVGLGEGEQQSLASVEAASRPSLLRSLLGAETTSLVTTRKALVWTRCHLIHEMGATKW